MNINRYKELKNSKEVKAYLELDEYNIRDYICIDTIYNMLEYQLDIAEDDYTDDDRGIIASMLYCKMDDSDLAMILSYADYDSDSRYEILNNAIGELYADITEVIAELIDLYDFIADAINDDRCKSHHLLKAYVTDRINDNNNQTLSVLKQLIPKHQESLKEKFNETLDTIEDSLKGDSTRVADATASKRDGDSTGVADTTVSKRDGGAS